MPTTSVTLAFRVMASLAVVLAPLAATAQTLTLTVPYRGASSMQSAKTVIEFDASTIAAGATIGVTSSGGTLVNVAVPSSPCVDEMTCTASGTASTGDDILVRRITQTNRAQLELSYVASFGNTPCAYVGSNSAKTYTVTLSGFTFGVANGYRITSYMAPSLDACEIAYVRVPSPRPNLAGPVTRLGRLPLNVVMVLDKSP